MSLTEPTLDRTIDAAQRVRESGALVEIRLDCLDDLHLDPAQVARAVGGRPLETIFTWRRPEDGGRKRLDENHRLERVASLSNRFGTWCDIELDRVDDIVRLGIDAERVVLSHHDFSGTPDLGDLYARLIAHRAGIYKIATLARDESDVFAHFAVLARAQCDGRRLVSIAMGPAGIPTRVLGPALGAPFSFCALDAATSSAPGQATLAAMMDLYRADKLDANTTVCGLIAGSVGYSLSPAMHNRAFAASGRNWVYVPFEVKNLRRFLSSVVMEGGRTAPLDVRGFSVTNPHKVEAYRLVDEVDPIARRVGAINTIVLEHGRVVGYNTDVAGAMEPLERKVGDLAGLGVGVLGAGGAARAVAVGLMGRKARCVVFARDVGRARAGMKGLGVRVVPMSEIAGERLDVLVNATPFGTLGLSDDQTPVCASSLRGIRCAYDLVYNPTDTVFLRNAQDAGCTTLGGLEMLATQAALQYRLWTGETANPVDFLEYAAAGLGSYSKQ